MIWLICRLGLLARTLATSSISWQAFFLHRRFLDSEIGLMPLPRRRVHFLPRHGEFLMDASELYNRVFRAAFHIISRGFPLAMIEVAVTKMV